MYWSIQSNSMIWINSFCELIVVPNFLRVSWQPKLNDWHNQQTISMVPPLFKTYSTSAWVAYNLHHLGPLPLSRPHTTRRFCDGWRSYLGTFIVKLWWVSCALGLGGGGGSEIQHDIYRSPMFSRILIFYIHHLLLKNILNIYLVHADYLL